MFCIIKTKQNTPYKALVSVRKPAGDLLLVVRVPEHHHLRQRADLEGQLAALLRIRREVHLRRGSTEWAWSNLLKLQVFEIRRKFSTILT